MTRLVVYGAGGHGRELADIARAVSIQDASWSLQGFVDDAPALHGRMVCGLPVLGGREWLDRDPDVAVVVGIGAPHARKRVTEALSRSGHAFPILVHPAAVVTQFVTFGPGVVVAAGCVLSNQIRVGAHTHLNRNSTVGHDCDIGAFVHLAPGAILSGNVRIDDGCDIGAGACILQGLNVGSGTIVGAGAVVTRDLPAAVTAVGVPARVLASQSGVDSDDSSV